nr:hypothetical protein [uncultured Albidiferax sp.]
MPVDNSDLERWRSLDAAAALNALADYAKEDASYVPRLSTKSTRWHVSVAGIDYEILCTGPKFWDDRANSGGGGALDLAMHLFGISFKKAARLLAERNL